MTKIHLSTSHGLVLKTGRRCVCVPEYVRRQRWWVRMPPRWGGGQLEHCHANISNHYKLIPLLSLKSLPLKFEDFWVPPYVTLTSENFLKPERNLGVTPQLSHQNLVGLVNGRLEWDSSDGSWLISPSETC